MNDNGVCSKCGVWPSSATATPVAAKAAGLFQLTFTAGTGALRKYFENAPKALRCQPS